MTFAHTGYNFHLVSLADSAEHNCHSEQNPESRKELSNNWGWAFQARERKGRFWQQITYPHIFTHAGHNFHLVSLPGDRDVTQLRTIVTQSNTQSVEGSWAKIEAKREHCQPLRMQQLGPRESSASQWECNNWGPREGRYFGITCYHWPCVTHQSTNVIQRATHTITQTATKVNITQKSLEANNFYSVQTHRKQLEPKDIFCWQPPCLDQCHNVT